MRIALSGASGLVGSYFSTLAQEQGHHIVPMVRDTEQEGIYWSVTEQALDAAALRDIDAVVHLAGENIGSGRWTSEKKRRIMDSRVKGTALIARSLASMDNGPGHFICASAVGYYGDRGDEWLTEDSEAGQGFLADVCRHWEAAADPARDTCRVVHTRLGPILSAGGGALEKMLTPFKLGFGGRLGKGDQYFSWVALHDVARALVRIIDDVELEGPVNVVGPQPVRNKEFSKILGQVLSRPAVMPAPAPALKLALGAERAKELLLFSQRVRPQKLSDQGFEFTYSTAEAALSQILD